MFGYVMIDKPELKVKEFYRYKAYYCGLCRELKEEYGFRGRMTLTYDMTFLVMFLTSPDMNQRPGRWRLIVPCIL